MKQYLLAGALSATVMAGMAFAAQPAPASGAARPMSDGVLTREEAQTLADKRFDRLDFNRDGKVSEETMMAAQAGKRGHGMRGRGGRGHGMHRGPDGMGRGPEGMAPPPPPPGAAPADRMAQMRTKAHERFLALDANKDGQLDRREFRTQAGERFAKLDANSDGKVDAAERFAAREKMREQRRQMRGAATPTPGA